MSDDRDRVPFVLWDNLKTLRLSQHVTTDSTGNEIHFPNSCSNERELYLHLPRTKSLHNARTRLQTHHHRHNNRISPPTLKRVIDK